MKKILIALAVAAATNIQGTYHLWKKVSDTEISDFDKVSGATIVDTYTLTPAKSAMSEVATIGRENVRGSFASVK